jgi:hypothetical protein
MVGIRRILRDWRRVQYSWKKSIVVSLGEHEKFDRMRFVDWGIHKKR